MSEFVIQADCIGISTVNLPSSLIAVAGYVTGTQGVQWTAADWARFPLAGKVRIDQTPDLAAFADGLADMADIEPGAATISSFIDAANQRSSVGKQSTAYISFGQYPDLLAKVKSMSGGFQVLIRYAIANWNWSADQAATMLGDNGEWVAVQFASPSSNPGTLLPGSTLTLAEAGADLSVKRASWFGSAYPAATAWKE